jgi:hypothetical protein
MLANILVFAFVGTFIAIAAFGHALLIMAIWPDLFAKQPVPHLDTVAEADASPRLYLPN